MLSGIGISLGLKRLPKSSGINTSESADASMIHTSQISQAITPNIINDYLPQNRCVLQDGHLGSSPLSVEIMLFVRKKCRKWKSDPR